MALREFKCLRCKIRVEDNRSRIKFCSKSCQQKYARSVNYGECPKFLQSGSMGALAEILVSADLMRRGYQVFRALSPNAPCDLIVLNNGFPLLVEVRTGLRNITRNTITFPRGHGGADLYSSYTRNTKEVVYIGISEKGKQFSENIKQEEMR